MKVLMYALLIAAVIGLAGCATEVAVSEVPEEAVNAAKNEVEGFVPTEAEMVEEDGQTVYELEGTAADGKTYEIEVTADGKVLEVEEEDEDEDEHDDEESEGEDKDD